MAKVRGATKWGVVTIDDVRGRCRIAPIEDACWVWAFGMSCADPREKRHPITWDARQQKSRPVRRVVFELARREIRSGEMVWARCGDARCVNPDHLVCGSRAQHGHWLRKTGRTAWRTNAAAVAAGRAVAMRWRAKLTPQIAEYIRRSQKSGVDLATELGVTQQTISKVRRLTTWEPLAGGL